LHKQRDEVKRTFCCRIALCSVWRRNPACEHGATGSI
jgi:hypothetical protein